MILVPTAIMFVALPIYRVQQIRLVSPGFDVSQFEASANEEAFATGDLYRRSNELLVRQKEELDLERPFTPQQREYLRKNDKALALLLEASRRPTCALRDPLTYVPTWLLTLSGHELEADGKLDEALDRYLATAHAVIHIGAGEISSIRYVFQEITQWAALPGQTPERIRTAIAKLQDFSAADLKFEDAVKNQYLAQRRWLSGDTTADANILSNGRQPLATAAVIDMLMPWERWRAIRALNVVTSNVLTAMQHLAGAIELQERDPHYNVALVGSLSPTEGYSPWWLELPSDIEALARTFPSPEGMDLYGAAMARDLVEFEALRRGTMIVLALEAYRLEHGELPETLQALAESPRPTESKANFSALMLLHPLWEFPRPTDGRESAPSKSSSAFFKLVPLDPYSGEEFRYFPHGVPDLPKRPDVIRQPTADAAAPADATDGIDLSLTYAAGEWQRKSIVAGVPGIWSTGPDLVGKQIEEQTYNPETTELEKSTPHLYYWLRWPGYGQNTLPNYEAWGKGIWFPIPERKEN
jgi:hypothetical protein